MGKKATTATVEAAAVQNTDAAAETAVQTTEPVAPAESAGDKALETAEARAADAEQARADAESRAVAAETALKAAQETAAPAAYADYKELPAVVAASLGLNLRTGPSMNYGVLETLSDGAPVTVLPLPYGAEIKGWALVVSKPGTRGWVMTEFLTEPPAEE